MEAAAVVTHEDLRDEGDFLGMGQSAFLRWLSRGGE
jgi:hypothetical protein